MCVIYISLYSLAFRARIDVVELIVRKNFLLRWYFLCFGSYILQSNLISRQNKFKCTNEAAIGKSLEIANRNN